MTITNKLGVVALAIMAVAFLLLLIGATIPARLVAVLGGATWLVATIRDAQARGAR